MPIGLPPIVDLGAAPLGGDHSQRGDRAGQGLVDEDVRVLSLELVV